ncbi:MAG: WD40 repeat domain-containing protein [Anaerolineaceae bacterium]|nr:WD40 repeat domain-containing protein [Anaerolineaceae bacterium]
MTQLVFSQKKPSSNSVPSELYRLIIERGFIFPLLTYFMFFLTEDFVNWWGLTTIVIVGLVIALIFVLGPILVVFNNRSARMQSLPVATVQVSPQEVVYNNRFGNEIVRVKDIKLVQVSLKSDGTISEILLYKGLLRSLRLQNFEDMPGLRAALIENLPMPFPWTEAKSPQFSTLQFFVFYVGGGWLWALLTGENFISSVAVGGLAAVGAYFAYTIVKHNKNASRTAKGALVVGAAVLIGYWLVGTGGLQRVVTHPCSLVNRWQNSGCLKAYPDSESLYFLPDNRLIRQAYRAIVIESVDSNRILNLFQATRLRQGGYISDSLVAADGRTAVTDDENGITIWNLADQSSTFLDKNFLHRSHIISPDGQFLAYTDRDSGVIVQTTSTMEPVFTQETEGFSEIALGQTLVAIGREEAVYFYEVRSGEETAVFSIDWSEEQDSVRLMAFSDDEQLLAFVTKQNILSILQRNGNEWQEIHRVQLDPAWQSDEALAFSADNALLAVAQDFYSTSENRGQLLIFSLADMELLRTIDLGRGLGQFGSVRVLDFSPDNTMLAVSSSSEGAVFELSLAK